MLNCANPANPILVASYDSPGTPYGVWSDGNYVYVADSTAGLEILKLGDVSKPNVKILMPAEAAAFEISLGLIDLSGTASDLEGIARVTWSNGRGGSAVATGTTSWSTKSVPLYSGKNVITVLVEDTSGNVTTATIMVNATLPDTTAPAITITGPKTDEHFVVKGRRFRLFCFCMQVHSRRTVLPCLMEQLSRSF